MLTAAQLKAARALVGMEQRALAEASGVSLPTIQRMEASNGNVRGVVDTLMKVMSALEAAGIEFIHEGAVSHGGGRGIRLRAAPRRFARDRPFSAVTLTAHHPQRDSQAPRGLTWSSSSPG